MTSKIFSKIKWLIDRWKIMDHPKEEFYRIVQQIQYNIIDRIWYSRPPIKNSFCYNENNNILKEHSIKGLKNILESTAIENIAEYRLLNVKIRDIITNCMWNYDFKNNQEGPYKFVHKIDDFDYKIGEVKYIYELSRLYHMPMLAAYAVANDNLSLINILEHQLEEWIKQNPFLGTIAWKSGNVVGIRALNLIYFRSILHLGNIDCKKVDILLSPLIELHYRFLLSHLSLYSSKGNHHIGEIAGIIAICSAYEFVDNRKIKKKFFYELKDEVLRLIYTDGWNKEQATRYQASYINLIITSYSILKNENLTFEDKVLDRLRNLYKYLRVMKVNDKEFFHIGDDDNAELLFPYFDSRYDEYESMLNDSVVLFDAQKENNYHYDLRNYLLWGDSGLEKYNQAHSIEYSNDFSNLYRESGYLIIKDKYIDMLFDVGQIGLMPTMSHGHSDMLNILLYINKKPVFVDCGSYQYNQKYKVLRDYFHGVHSHNTISVNNLDQAEKGEGMFWLSNPNVTIEEYHETEDYIFCSATHDGYKRSKDSVLHKRSVEYRKKDHYIIITDELLSSQIHNVKLYFHFHPSAKVVLSGSTIYVDDVMIINSLFSEGRIVKGDVESPLGWFSKRYDSIEPTTSFVWDGLSDKKIRTLIKFQ